MVTDIILSATIPLVITGTGWTVIKVIAHDSMLKSGAERLQRIEDKLDRVIERQINDGNK